MIKYVVFSYLLFIVFIAVIGFIMFVLNLETLGQVLAKISAWTSTFVFIFLFKKIYPNDFFLEFVKRQFCIKNPRRKQRGIEDFSLKSSRMRVNKSPVPPVLRPKGRGIKPAFG
jgi:hypothetical protein